MRRDVRRVLALFGVLAVFVHRPASTQEHFEIAVYPYATAHRGEWEFEGHLNYASRGTSDFSGSVAPTQGQWRLAAEVTRGITDHWEIAGYLLGAQVPVLGFEYAGWRLRSRVRAPESWRLPVRVGFSAEYETARPAFSESARTLEFTAILERRFGGVQLLADPTFERDLDGPEREFEFEPRVRAGLDVSKKLTLGFEYYGVLEATAQKHQVYPTADVRFGDDMTLHFGVGFGGTSADDRLVFKTRFEMPLGGEK
jgi:hypothetical protein